MMKRMGIAVLVFGLALFVGSTAQAVPYAGVSGGTYIGGCEGDYRLCFSGGYSSSGEGFNLPNSGGTITVWADEDRVGTRDIWLVAESSLLGLISFGGQTPDSFTLSGSKLSGYQGTPYSAINLGQVTGGGSWAGFSDGEFASGDFYKWVGTITYNASSSPTGDWLFVVASSNNILGDSHDKISPQTSSAVPEPGTLLLLGSGLVGLGLYRRKFKL